MGNSVSCSTPENMYLLNELCTNGSNSSNLECYKDHGPMTEASRIITGAWYIFIAFIGIFGNLTTLVAIPYAAKKKRYGIHTDYCTTTVFLLHLSFVDLLHCVLNAIPRGIMYLNNSSPFGIYGCQIVLYSGMSIFVADILALALVALSRCLDTVLTTKWTDFCSKRRNSTMLFLLCWAISLMVIPVMLTIHSYGIEIGWNCETGGCGFIRNCKKLENFIQLSRYIQKPENCSVPMGIWRNIYIFVFLVPVFSILTIICSYSIIFCKVHQSKSNFSNEERTFNFLRKRQKKMTCTTLILISLNVIFWLIPFVIMTITYDKKLSAAWKPMNGKNYIAYSVFINIFEIQYALNFFVYIFRSPQYRSAFFDIFKNLFNFPLNSSCFNMSATRKRDS